MEILKETLCFDWGKKDILSFLRVRKSTEGYLTVQYPFCGIVKYILDTYFAIPLT
jgi:hypothetical protein